MKYIFSSVLAICFSMSLLAQKSVGEIGVYGKPLHKFNKAVSDTVFNGFENYNPVVYTVPDITGGYVSGSNGYKDQQKAQELVPSASSYLTGAIFWFGKKVKNTGGDTSSVILKYYRKDSVQLVAGTYRFIPGTVVLADTVKLNDIPVDTNLATGMYVWNFPAPELLNSAFYLGFDMQLMNPKDSIALFTSTDGEVIASDLSWENWLNTWNTIENAWGLNIDLAIFPIFDITNASVENIQNLDVHMYPNPAQNEIFVQAKEAIKNMSIIDLNGRVIMTNTASSQINISQLPAATYVIKVETQSGKVNFGRFIKAQ